MCAWRIPSISPTRSPPPTVTRKSLCKLKNCFRVQTIKSLPSPFCVLTLVSEMTRKGWELSSSCRRRGGGHGRLKSSCWDGCSPGDRRKPTGSCSHGRVLLAPAICLPACPASQPTDQIIQYETGLQDNSSGLNQPSAHRAVSLLQNTFKLSTFSSFILNLMDN